MCDKNKNKDDCCNFEYLKPLSIDALFEVDDCTKYADTLEKAKRVRNGFFAAKTSVFNFINDCDVIADTLQSDLSDNAVELDNIKDQYKTVLNNLTSSLYTSLKTTYNDRTLVNVDLAKVDDSVMGPNCGTQAARAQKSADLAFSHPYGNGVTTLCYVPGVVIQLNTKNRMLKLKLAQPDLHSGYNRHGAYKKEKDVVTTLILAPSIECVSSWVNWDEGDDENNGSRADGDMCDNFGETRPCTLGTNPTVFSNVDIAMDFFEEYQNYQDNYIIEEDSSYGNQVLEVMNYFDRVIHTMEGAHKFVVQLSKINNANDCDDNKR